MTEINPKKVFDQYLARKWAERDKRMAVKPPDVSIAITWKNQCELAIGFNDRLYVIQRDARSMIIGHVDLGPATEKCFKDLRECVKHLAIHAVEEKING